MVNIKQNPFSLYDFLGYLTPGAIFFYGLLYVFNHSGPFTLFICDVNQYLGFDKPAIYIPFILASYTTGHFLSFLSSIFIEQYSIWAFDYPSRYLFELKRDKKELKIRILYFILSILILPIWVCDCLFSKIGIRVLYAKELEKPLVDLLENKLKDFIKEHAGIKDKEKIDEAINQGFFRYIYHYALENANSHLPKFQNYVALYGFLRTITLITAIFYWRVVIHVYKGTLSYYYLFLFLIPYVFFMGFSKIFRKFTVEVFMAFSVIYHIKEGKLSYLD